LNHESSERDETERPVWPAAGTKTGIFNCDLFSFSVEIFVSLVLFVAQIFGGKKEATKDTKSTKEKRFRG